MADDAVKPFDPEDVKRLWLDWEDDKGGWWEDDFVFARDFDSLAAKYYSLMMEYDGYQREHAKVVAERMAVTDEIIRVEVEKTVKKVIASIIGEEEVTRLEREQGINLKEE